jgi:hypothetical protein
MVGGIAMWRLGFNIFVAVAVGTVATALVNYVLKWVMCSVFAVSIACVLSSMGDPAYLCFVITLSAFALILCSSTFGIRPP